MWTKPSRHSTRLGLMSRVSAHESRYANYREPPVRMFFEPKSATIW